MGPSYPENARPFKIDRIDHVLLIVRGMAEALRFYEDVLGCVVEGQLPRYGMAELRAGASHIDLVDVATAEGAWAGGATPGRNVDHVALRLLETSESALRAYLAAAGIAIAEERVEGNGSVSFYVADPSGNTLELIAVT